MKAQLKQTAIHMLTLALLFVAAYLFAGCSATKIKFEKTSDGTTKYSIWHNDHWLKTEAESLTGGMSENGKFEFDLEGMKSSPSEEFNRTMQTYTSALVQFMQIAAAAYNPSSSAAAAGKETTTVNVQVPSTGEAAAKEVKSVSDSVGTGSVESSTGNNAASDPHAAECTDGSCTTGECTDGSYTPEVK